MLHNYKSYILVCESKRDNKIKKQTDKIHKFLTYEPLIDWIIKRVVDREGTKGLQYVVWFADKLKTYLLKWLFLELSDKKYVSDIAGGEDSLKKTIKTFLETGEVVGTEKLQKKKVWFKKDIYASFKRMLDGSDGTVMVASIIDWLKSPIREEEIVNLSQYNSLKEASDRAIEWHENIKATGVVINEEGTVLMTFEDGYYWIDLETTECEDEAKAMGHCGRTDYGTTMYSLRRKQSPHVTAAIEIEYNRTNDDGSSEEGYWSIIHQMKGRENKKPIEKYHPYILELLSYPNVSDNVKIINDIPKVIRFSTEEYMPEEDFAISDLNMKQISKLHKANPELISTCGLSVLISLYQDGVISAEELVKNIPDAEVVNGEIHFLLDDWIDFDQEIFTGDWQMNVFSDDSITDLLWYERDFDYKYWDKLELNVYENILKECIKNHLFLEYDDDYKEFEMDKENSKISPNKDDIWINTPIGGVLSLGKMLAHGYDKASTHQGEKQFKSPGLVNLRKELNRAFSMAQAWADENEARKVVIDAICDTIGPIVLPKRSKAEMKRLGKYWNDNKIHIKIDLDFIKKAYNNYKTENISISDIINNGAYWSNINGYDLRIECDIPNDDGEISIQDLSMEIINNIHEIHL